MHTSTLVLLVAHRCEGSVHPVPAIPNLVQFLLVSPLFSVIVFCIHLGCLLCIDHNHGVNTCSHDTQVHTQVTMVIPKSFKIIVKEECQKRKEHIGLLTNDPNQNRDPNSC